MTSFDLLDALLLILLMVWLPFFTARTHSWLIQFLVEPGSCWEKHLSSQSIHSLCCHIGFFLPWCGTSHFFGDLQDLSIGPLLQLVLVTLGNSPVLQFISSSSQLGIFSKIINGVCYLFNESVNKAAEWYWSCYCTLRDITSSWPSDGLCTSRPLNSVCHQIYYPLMSHTQPILFWMTKHII